ncbi:ParB/RepB/Spo0J family partition protein [uncultured Bacteroides sp.]|uniref:ParB/RepB/Spo0J family partition protein n=1 Tax=uncultured Bacteroides sp. TaxID=162156 RepID=UPI002AAB0C1B|nr:ParB/RepB/Spo0J family partition protein [uncultured Bacteroides sp.]
MAVHKKFTLGRGLDALISMDEVKTEGSSSINEIELSKISVNPSQPRHEFDQAALEELAESIKEIGIIQPITLRKISDDSYQIIAGERRYRATQLAGLETITAYIRTADDENVMEMALIENIQREDLNSLEIALAYQHLIEQYDLTQERLSERVGKKRTTIANYLRLLKLPAQIQVALQNKTIDMGHARALITLNDPKLQVKVYEEILHNSYSVRKVEEIVKALNEGETIKSGNKKLATKGNKLPEEFNILKKHLSGFFNAKVQLSCTAKGKGKISIPFSNEEDLERIMEIFDSLKNKETN